MTSPNWRALTLRQPWADAVVFGGKRVENRLKWMRPNGTFCGPVKFRGDILIHAASQMLLVEHKAAAWFITDRKIRWTWPAYGEITLGAIIGAAKVVGAICNEHDLAEYVAGAPDREEQRLWWMGGFALVLDEVRATKVVPCKGMLGYWKVPEAIAREALGCKL